MPKGWNESSPANVAPLIPPTPTKDTSEDGASLLRQLDQSEQKLHALANRLLTIRDEEQFRISREIHDCLGQALAVLKLDLQWIARQLPDDAAMQDKAAAMAELIDTTIRSLREIVVRLRPDILDQLGLVAAIEHQARDFEAHTGIQCKVDAQGDDAKPDSARDTTLLRIFQETLTNVARHAHATQVSVHLGVHDNKLRLEVADNGKGMAPESLRRPNALGLVGMRERLAPLAGQLQILSPSSGGTLVRVSIPLTSPANHEDTDRG